MSTFGTFADIHCHTLLKYVQNDVLDFWTPIGMRNKILQWFGVVRFTAADFKTLAEGEVQLVCVVMTPPEQKTLFFQGNVSKNALERFSSYLTRIPVDKMKNFQSENYDHHELLLREKKLYEGGQNLSEIVKLPSTGKTKCRYQLVKNFGEVDSILEANKTNANERVIAVVYTIESAHALGRGHVDFNGAPNKFNVSDEIVLKRIDAMKGIGSPEAEAWGNSPLWMTMVHVFSNDICGFAQPLEKQYRNLLDYSEPFPSAKTPPKYVAAMNTGFTPFGKSVIERLLGIDAVSLSRTDKGRRIYVDIKHMSTKSRSEYYELIDNYNTNNPTDIIPVIMSHAAVNGKSNLDENGFNPVDTDEEADNSGGLNPWSINLYDDEIVRIHKTKGLIGLIFFEPILAGKKKRKGKLFWGRDKWADLFADQIEHIVKTVYDTGTPDKKEIWNRICLGSDFDGQINPVDKFATADQLPEFMTFLKKFLNSSRFDPYRDKGEVNELANKICFTNVVEFMKSNFK